MRAENPSAWLPGTAAKLRSAFAELLQAELYARDTNLPSWQFAVDVEELLASGLTANDLRWLIAKGYVEIARKIRGRRLFQPRRFDSRPNSRSNHVQRCLILTDDGLAMAERLCCALSADFGGGASRKAVRRAIPRWDATGRTLWFGSLIKRFTVPAPNQEAVLAAFENDGWPSCIPDPMPAAEAIDAKRRLHDTINRLNRCHQWRAIRFGGNGIGSGICWRRIADTGPIRTITAPDRV
jgi:hypothetical protein